MAKVPTITVDRGTTYALTVKYIGDGSNDITGSTILFTVKSTEFDDDTSDSTALIQKDITSHTSPLTGVSTITILPVDTRDLDPGNYYYSVKIDMLSNDAIVYELSEGRFKLDGDPTNRIA